MQQYEKPQVEILEFICRQTLASSGLTEPALIDDSLSVGETPTFKEDIEDW